EIPIRSGVSSENQHPYLLKSRYGKVIREQVYASPLRAAFCHRSASRHARCHGPQLTARSRERGRLVGRWRRGDGV
ncbi:hypothetical protein ACSTLM_00305, partial [Vibrio parahaemolyticus]